MRFKRLERIFYMLNFASSIKKTAIFDLLKQRTRREGPDEKKKGERTNNKNYKLKGRQKGGDVK